MNGESSLPTPSAPMSKPRPGDQIKPISYRKKPVVIEAIRWSGTNLRAVIDFTGLHPSAEKWTWEEYEAIVAKDGLRIFTLEDGKDGSAKHIADIGDWIIRGVKGEFYACKPDIFAMTYERADASKSETSSSEAPTLSIMGLPLRLHAPTSMLKFSDHIIVIADNEVPEGTVEIRDTLGRTIGRIINVW